MKFITNGFEVERDYFLRVLTPPFPSPPLPSHLSPSKRIQFARATGCILGQRRRKIWSKIFIIYMQYLIIVFKIE